MRFSFALFVDDECYGDSSPTIGNAAYDSSPIIYGASNIPAAASLRSLFRVLGTMAVHKPRQIVSGLGIVEPRTSRSEKALTAVCNLSHLCRSVCIGSSYVRSYTERNRNGAFGASCGGSSCLAFAS